MWRKDGSFVKNIRQARRKTETEQVTTWGSGEHPRSIKKYRFPLRTVVRIAGHCLCRVRSSLLSSFSSVFPEEVPPFTGYDKLAHFIRILLFRHFDLQMASQQKEPLRQKRHALFLSMLIGIGYALSATSGTYCLFREGLQTMWDVLFDAVGIAPAAVLTYRYQEKYFFITRQTG